MKEITAPLQRSPRRDVQILVDPKGDLARQYAVRQVPAGIALDARGRVVGQTMNPHANWLYKVLDVEPPQNPIVDDATGGWESLTLPASFQDLIAR